MIVLVVLAVLALATLAMTSSPPTVSVVVGTVAAAALSLWQRTRPPR